MGKNIFLMTHRIKGLQNTLFLTSLVLIPALYPGSSGIMMINAASAANHYYLSPNGNDSNPGTLTQPWKTLEHAFSKLAPGDMLSLRAGTYYYPSAGGYGLEIPLKGTASAPIIIESYPGERARISGALPEFETAPNSEWELVDASIHLYRSVQPVPFDKRRFGGWLLDYDIKLLAYNDFELLTSINYDSRFKFFAGPGIYGAEDGHVYIRLAQNPFDLFDIHGNPIPPLLTDLNPNHHRISIFSAYAVLGIKDASHLNLKNLEIGPAAYGVSIENSSHDIEVDHNRIIYLSSAVASDASTYNLDIHHNELTAGFPEWNYWADVKEDLGLADIAGWNSFAISGEWRDSDIHENILLSSFDGIAIGQGSSNTRVTDNIIIRSRDDAIDLWPNVVNIEVARNIIRHCYEGISINSEDDNRPVGYVYIHHNIIDMTGLLRHTRIGRARGLGREKDLVYDGVGGGLGNGWTQGIAFGGHGCSDFTCVDARWKIYNNTIIGNKLETATTRSMIPLSINNPHLRFFNNLFCMIGDGPVIPQTAFFHRASSGMVFDGNLYWKTGSDPLFEDFGADGIYASLAEFVTDPSTAPWERTNALQIDPGFDIEAIQAESYDLETMLELYRPSHPQVFTPGVSYDGLNWPGTETVNYRGAIAQKLSTHINPNAMDTPDEFYLYQNSPNPFNSSTAISYRLSQSSHVILTIYNTEGQEVHKLVDEFQTAGTYTVTWNGINRVAGKVSSGIYFYKIKALNYSMFKKMLFLK